MNAKNNETRTMKFKGWKLPIALLAGSLCASCSVIRSTDSAPVVYALPMQDGVVSPLGRLANPAAEELHFARDRYSITSAQQRQLAAHAEAWARDGKPLVIAAAASRSLPPDYARVLSERRAKSVRQALIELGMDPTLLHTTGYGNDAPALADGDLVAIYAGTPPPPPAPPASPDKP